MSTKEEMTAPFKLAGVGKQIAKHLARLEIFSVTDLLFHFPLRYQDRTHVEPIRQTRPDQEAVVEGVIQAVTTPSRGRTKLLCELQDHSGRLFLRFFHVMSFQTNILKPGTRLRCYSTVRLGPKGLEMSHPEFIVLSPDKSLPVETHLTPVYPATEGLTQYTLRKLTTNALAQLKSHASFTELMPEVLLQQYQFPSFKEAIYFIHRPLQTTCITALAENKTLAQQRLIFEELIAHRLSLLQLKKRFQMETAPSLLFKEGHVEQLLAQLPFSLTNAQARVIKEIQNDLQQSSPMLRLVQGDVGSGKTVIAAVALLQAVTNGYQAALMAPTELLAEQHHRVMQRWLQPLGIQIVFLSGNVKARARTAVLKSIESGEAQIVLGTHALFQTAVNFAKLGLIVVDEQHRFGVNQRAQLREKGKQQQFFPHQLIMTATPIPRTLAMSFYADLDCSIVDELPPGRTPITTSVLANARREEIMLRVRDACLQGRQAYWVCPLIEESDSLNCQAAVNTAEQLQQYLPNIRVGLIHGRMKGVEKEAAMQAFQAGDAQLLVATTVIEVGVDVPNASVMVIENAERLGLSQLHQLRGRVGRGSVASYCILLYQHPLSDIAKERLSVMRETTDGFQIAERDLQLRGPGEVLGTRQTGDIAFQVADLLRDAAMLADVQKAADIILQDYPAHVAPLMERWLKEASHYAKV